MNNDKILPKHLSAAKIRAIADRFRDTYVDPTDPIPVPIEEIVEFDLELEVFSERFLKQNIDVDGFLSNDLKTIYVDEEFIKDINVRRYRFTLAHEVGHYVLHKEEIGNAEFETPEEWKEFRMDMDEESLTWFEWQANEFAGRLLVPREKLIEVLERQREKIEFFYHEFPNGDDAIIDTISAVICDEFLVSEQVIQTRIRKENIWQELGFGE